MRCVPERPSFEEKKTILKFSSDIKKEEKERQLPESPFERIASRDWGKEAFHHQGFHGSLRKFYKRIENKLQTRSHTHTYVRVLLSVWAVQNKGRKKNITSAGNPIRGIEVNELVTLSKAQYLNLVYNKYLNPS